jgi:hypothetical protein
MATVALESGFDECQAGVVDVALGFIQLVDRECDSWLRQLPIAVPA